MDTRRLTLSLFLLLSSLSNVFGDDLKNYVVILRHLANANISNNDNRDKWHASLLSESLTGTDHGLSSSDRLIYSYRDVVNGFAARLTEKEVEEMAKNAWFAYAIPSSTYELMTTYSPRFLGLSGVGGVWNESSNMGEGVIVGIIDSGIKSDHPSFNDTGMLRPPSRWRGRCDFQRCNNKLIGGQAFNNGSSEARQNPEDVDGHGTHVASTAAGAFVREASYYGLANGVASGMAPRAHLAMYRACGESGCMDTDIMAAVETAVQDGVDVLSISMGMHSTPFYKDIVAISTFYAINGGVFVCCSAGNDGPKRNTLKNEAPWVLTVAASTTDRRFVSTVKLGNGLEFDGQTIFQPGNYVPQMMPLVYAADHGMPKCGTGSLNDFNVTGKIVLCEVGGGDGEILIDSGAAAVIFINYEIYGYSTRADPTEIPTSNVAYADGTKIVAYIRSTANPTATLIFKGTLPHAPWSPAVSPFSSRGPSIQSPGILKPDITGPGENILAASHKMLIESWDYSTTIFKIMSGISMSTPHLCGIAALIRKAHPDWSPAAVKSAIITTADVVNHDGKPIVDETRRPASYFAMGAGHVNPRKALDPGLVYDLAPEDYIPYLCGLGYNDDQVSPIIHPRPPAKCSQVKKITASELNYPSISVFLPEKSNTSVSVTRVVTNVGEARSSYWLEINPPEGVSVRVVPTKLTFDHVNQKKTFTISFERIDGGGRKTVEGHFKWVSKRRVVRSPISIALY
ncbi:subtilisin-like protease 4 [Typha angustifolia]|uniref:subtilisin-like protease 4 n=1 Tax=Typha angustifolia TaxID=59011 RepID=UPI003C2E539E